MFTGIITHIGIIASAEKRGDLRIEISCDLGTLKIGESIACNGACLTVVASSASGFTTELSAETIARTAPRWSKGDRLNLERALKLGDGLDGHLVTGHVDGIATVKSITPSESSYILEIEAPEELAKFIAEKGSVTLDGVSLTVNKVGMNPVSHASGCTGSEDGSKKILRNRINDSQDSCFWVNIIPHTWQNTTLGERQPGDALNLEIDLMARYAARLLEK